MATLYWIAASIITFLAFCLFFRIHGQSFRTASCGCALFVTHNRVEEQHLEKYWCFTIPTLFRIKQILGYAQLAIFYENVLPPKPFKHTGYGGKFALIDVLFHGCFGALGADNTPYRVDCQKLWADEAALEKILSLGGNVWSFLQQVLQEEGPAALKKFSWVNFELPERP